MITEGDLTKKVIAEDLYLCDTEVKTAMSTPIASIESDIKMVDALAQLYMGGKQQEKALEML